MSELTVSTCKYMVFIRCFICLGFEIKGWLVLRVVASRCGASNWVQERAEHHGSKSKPLRDVGPLQQARNGTERNRLDINGILWIC